MAPPTKPPAEHAGSRKGAGAPKSGCRSTRTPDGHICITDTSLCAFYVSLAGGLGGCTSLSELSSGRPVLRGNGSYITAVAGPGSDCSQCNCPPTNRDGHKAASSRAALTLGTLGHAWTHFWVSQLRVLPASSRQRRGMLLNILPCPGWPPTQNSVPKGPSAEAEQPARGPSAPLQGGHGNGAWYQRALSK